MLRVNGDRLSFPVRDIATARAVVSQLKDAVLDATDDTIVVSTRVSDHALRLVTKLGMSPAVPTNLDRYTWPGRFKPFKHQETTVKFLVSNQRGFVLNDIGTGKTLASLWAADFLMSRGVIRKALVIAPLSTLECVWADTMFSDLHHRKYAVLHASNAAARRKKVQPDKDFYIVNHAGFSIVADILKDIDLIIIDEVAVYRNQRTNRFKALHSWLAANPMVWVWGMTGTPTPNEPTDAWAQAKLLGVPGIPRSFTRFRDQTMMRVTQWKWAPRAKAEEHVKKILVPATRASREECLDLPPTVFSSRHVPLSAQQTKFYKELMREAVAKYSGADSVTAVTAVNAAVMSSKLLQISAGAVYGTKGEVLRFEDNGRLKVVSEIIEEAGGKVLVFAAYKPVVKNIVDFLKDKYTVESVTGDTPAKDRDRIFRSFQREDDPRVLVAHPGTMAHGLTLTRARTIVWHSPVTSNETFMQANGRIERPGKEGSGTVIMIEGSHAERKTYKALQAGQWSQKLLLDLIEEYGT